MDLCCLMKESMTKGALGKDSILSWPLAFLPHRMFCFPVGRTQQLCLSWTLNLDRMGCCEPSCLLKGQADPEDTSSVSGHNYGISYSLKSPVSTIEP